MHVIRWVVEHELGKQLINFLFFYDEGVNLTSEKHDPCAQKSPTQKKKTRTPYRRHRCGAGQIPSEG